MRLINVHSLKLDFFPNKKTRPPYAILSHRWSDNEATFEAFTSDPHLSHPGLNKVRSFCEIVRLQQIVQNVDYCWVDSCCIDKRSSAELSEAINSMASWYAESQVCIVYLADVPPIDTPIEDSSGVGLRTSIYRSEWFTRGWSLQELLFPPRLVFCHSQWSEIPDLEKQFSMLNAITNIPVDCLQDRRKIPRYCIADRMSWAARRETTREEDSAYCLLGLFNIHMPLLYGEGGSQAFNRLQRAIIETSEDESIFAWVHASKGPNSINRGLLPILAPQVSYFAYHERKKTKRALLERRPPYHITNRGLEIEGSAIEFSDHPESHVGSQRSKSMGKELLLIQMNCTATYDEGSIVQPWLIALQQISAQGDEPVYARMYSWTSPYMISEIMMSFKRNNRHVTIRRLPPRRYYIATTFDQLRGQAVETVETSEDEKVNQPALEELFRILNAAGE